MRISSNKANCINSQVVHVSLLESLDNKDLSEEFITDELSENAIIQKNSSGIQIYLKV